MWEVTEENKTLLKDWTKKTKIVGIENKVENWIKKKPLILDFEELMEVLKPLANHHPIYQFIDDLRVHVPVVKKEVNSAYKARIERLKWEQENKEYLEMTRSIDPNQHYGKTKMLGTFGEEIRSVNRQIIAVFNTLLTVGGAFSFGFYGLSFAYPNLNMSFVTRMTIGLVLATIVFFADLYFIMKGMNDSEVQNIDQPSKSVKKNIRSMSIQKDEINAPEVENMKKEISDFRLKSNAKGKNRRVKKVN